MTTTIKKIVLISSGQPSLNPRLVKEADNLVAHGYQVTVIYQFWNQWGTTLDEDLLKQKKWRAILVGGSPRVSKYTYWLSRIRHKLGQKLIAAVGVKAPFAEMALGRCTNLLTREALKHPANLYVAHNLAALPAAVTAARKHGVKCGFDAEDYHRNEVSDDINNIDVKLKAFIEDIYIPQVNYLTTSSPLISAAYTRLYNLSPITILNTFLLPAKPLNVHRADEKLRLFWFSQTISLERGVGDCIKVLAGLNDNTIELNLLGYATNIVKLKIQEITDGKVTVIIHPPIPPDDIIPFASQFDIGLAMEDSTPYNRDICLTNKIFTYIQAGLAVIATDTTAQTQLLKKYPHIGLVYQKKDINSLTAAIRSYKDNQEQLSNTKQSALQAAAKDLNWEHESKKFLQLVKTIFTS